MDKVTARIVAIALALSTSGCAYLTTFKESMDLASNSYSVDVKQRVVVALNRVPTLTEKSQGAETRRVVCAEPSPDALATISASAGLDFVSKLNTGSTPQDLTAKVAAALSEQGAFIGLRTQSIQLLRDAMYRACEGYAAGAVSDVEFTTMQRRYQSTMMGLLAIEQLTRPIVAQQVVLAGNAQAQAGASPADAAVEKAQQRLDAAIKEDTQAQVELSNARAELGKAQSKLEENRKQEAEAREKAVKTAKAEADVRKDTADKAAAAIQEASEQAAKPSLDARPALVTDIRTKEQAVKAEEIEAAAAAAARRTAQGELNAMKSRASASAAGGGQFGAMREASANITHSLVQGVQDIVRNINDNYARDGCFSMIQGIVRHSSQARELEKGRLLEELRPDGVLKAALEACVNLVNQDAEKLKIEADFTKARTEVLRSQQQRGTEPTGTQPAPKPKP